MFILNVLLFVLVFPNSVSPPSLNLSQHSGFSLLLQSPHFLLLVGTLCDNTVVLTCRTS